jgi:DNA replication protein DnaC
MNEQILEKMQKMRLHGMARIFQNSLEKSGLKLLTPDEMVAHLVEAEWDDRYNRKLDRSLQSAHFRYKAAIEQIAFDENRVLDKNQVLRLAECTFIKKKENVLITGSTGVGKSFVASALGHQACSLGYKVMYSHSTKLFAKLKLAKADGTYLKELSKMEKQDLLLIDDFGIQPLDAQSRTSLMEIIEDRHGKSSTMFTSQVPIGMWHEVIGEQTIADAILDRIVHDSHRLEMKGESMRKRKSTMTELTY